jgi:hypothetical protein
MSRSNYRFYCGNEIYIHINNNAIAAGTVWIKKMLRCAVMAPYMPATAMQLKKKVATNPAHRISVMQSDQINPAAKKPLYNPWLAASFWVGSNKEAGMLLKTLGPRVVHKNISNTKIYRCKRAMMPINSLANTVVVSIGKYKMLAEHTAQKMPQLFTSSAEALNALMPDITQ